MTVKYVTHNGSDTYANASSFSTPMSLATAAAGATAGDEIRVCNTGTYTLTSTTTWNNSGSAASGQIVVVGANSSGTVDGTRPTITSATNSVALFSINNGASGYKFRYLKGTHTATTRGAMFAGTGTAGQLNIQIVDCWCDGCLCLWDGSSRACSGLTVANTYATNCTSGVIKNGSSPGGTGAATSNFGDTIDGCFFFNNTGAAYDAQNSTFSLTVTRSVLAKNGRAITDGGTGSTRSAWVIVRDSIIANNTTEGITNANSLTVWNIALANNIIYGNGGYGVGLLGTAAANDYRGGFNRNNFVGSNTSGNYNNLSAGVGDVTLTTDPFIGASTGDFRLNNTSGGGASVRGAGYPGAFVGGLTTGYADGGAVQHQDLSTIVTTGNSLMKFLPQNGEPTSTNYATLNTRNGIMVAEFDDSTIETLIFRDVIPSHYNNGGLTFDIFWMGKTATSGDVKWGVSVERDDAADHDLDADAFATEQTATGTANAASGKITKTTVTVSAGANMDSATAGDPVRIKIRRIANDAADTMTGDAQLHSVHVKES